MSQSLLSVWYGGWGLRSGGLVGYLACAEVHLSKNSVAGTRSIHPFIYRDCGYGEGGDAYCTACPPRRYKSSWGHHRCQTCITCAVINRIQKANCTATSNAICGNCLPRFYQKTRIGGLQDQECIPCTKQTPTSEVQFAGGSLQYEAGETAEEESLFPIPPGQKTSPESPLSESIFETQPLNSILDDNGSSTHGFPIQESFTLASCASESHSHWVHTPVECTELDLRKFSSSASYTGAETLAGNAAESSGDRPELTVLFEVLSP
ncbi:tumor necrosis factor receptor superfamily member 27 isoform X3 [Bubalus bubalis]|uniref:tumor necrosis factor receptor superfamily member 27 isoform X3 n=1 Tax=Bubalus bubalis TaxID=89462 RepID=UPI000DBC8E8E|nr:tumor necrosis factor receptor superfamily member 27 isoform X3 [Bubalus bubalis]